VLTASHSVSRQFGVAVALFVARTKLGLLYTSSPVRTLGSMGDRLWAGTHWYVTKPTKSTQPCIPLGSLNRVPALIGCWNILTPLLGGR